MQDYQLPEMLRVGIEDLVLQILILDLGEPTSFLSKALNPPSDLAMANSLKLLETLGAVECQWQQNRTLREIKHTNDEGSNTFGELKVTSELTALGFHLATLPVDPRVGKMMIYGSLFGCIDPALTVAASMSARSPFVSPFDQRDAADAARKKFAVEASDHLTILNAFQEWKDLRKTEGNRAVQSFIKDNFLGRLTLFQMEDLRKQFSNLLSSIGFLPKGFRLTDLGSSENANSKNIGLVKAVLCAGLYPNIIVAPRTLVGTSGKSGNQTAGECSFQTHTKGEVYLHPSTIAFKEKKLDTRYCCYHEMVKTSKTYVRDCTSVSPFALLLFGGDLKVYQAHGVCSIDDWLKFRIESKPATLVKYLRGQMERILLRKIVSPHEDVFGSEEGKALIQSISMLFEQETQKEATSDRGGGEIVRPWTGPEGGEANSNQGGRGNGQRGGGGRGRGRGRGRGGGGRGRDRGDGRS
jgi:HrpA-like RNA helicase